jgi:hypothetical protein
VKPVARTPSGERLAEWFVTQANALSAALDECSTDAREYIRAQLRTVERVRDHVMREVAYAEVEAISMVTAGSTLSDASRWLDDAIGGDESDVAA